MPELTYREAVRDALSHGDAPGRRRLHHGRGHRRDGRLDGRHGRDARRVRPGAGAQHADLGDGDRGAAIGAAMQGMRPVVEIMYEDFLTLVDGADRQPGREAPLHVGRAAQGAARRSARRAAPAGRRARSTRSSSRRGSSTSPGSRSSSPRRRTTCAACSGRRSTTTTPSSSSSTGRSTRSRTTCRRSSSRSRSDARASTARART